MRSVKGSAWGYILFFTAALAACRVEENPQGAVTDAAKTSISFSDGTSTLQPGPVNPIPNDLWKPATGATPSSGNYIYLESDTGDKVGQGIIYTYTPANAAVTFTPNGGYLSIVINGASNWMGEFKTKDSLNWIQIGYYAGLLKYPSHDVLWGGLKWSKNGVSCTKVDGWVAIDDVTYSGTKLSALDMRFEQRCDGSLNALHGKIHWII